MTDLAALVDACLAHDLSAAAGLADALQEMGREREAVLLRRRWRRWEKERSRARQELYHDLRNINRLSHESALAHLTPHNVGILCGRADRTFRAYIRTRFAPKPPKHAKRNRTGQFVPAAETTF